MKYVTESVHAIADFLCIVIGEGYCPGCENTYKKYYYLMPYNF